MGEFSLELEGSLSGGAAVPRAGGAMASPARESAEPLRRLRLARKAAASLSGGNLAIKFFGARRFPWTGAYVIGSPPFFEAAPVRRAGGVQSRETGLRIPRLPQ